MIAKSINRKARGDSKLKTLPPDKQKVIVEWLQTGTREAARRKCASELGVETSGAALSEFYSWYFLGRQLEQAANFANSLKADLKGIAGIALGEEQINAAAQVIFEKLAVEEGNFKQFFLLRKLRQKDKEVALEREKFEFDAVTACMKRLPELKAIADNSDLSEDEKVQAMRERLFGVAPE